MKWTLVANLAMFAPASASYVWPSTQDSMDDLLYLQSGYIRNGQLADRRCYTLPLLRSGA